MRASNSEIFSALNVKPSVNRTSLRQITNILNTGSTSPKAKFTLEGEGEERNHFFYIPILPMDQDTLQKKNRLKTRE